MILSRLRFNSNCRLRLYRPYGTTTSTLKSNNNNHTDDHDEEGEPYNEMQVPAFKTRPLAEPESGETDWNRRIIVYGYGFGFAAFAYLYYYQPDTTVETWAHNEAMKRMRARQVDMFWYEPDLYKKLI